MTLTNGFFHIMLYCRLYHWKGEQILSQFLAEMEVKIELGKIFRFHSAIL